jgi:gamma-glutamyl-gamma-aminobutyrate hydrolase PuuD
LINQYLGGSTSLIPTHMNSPQKHSVLYTENNKSLTIQVNSYHNNIITRDTLAKDLEPIATDKNGAIEAAYSKSLQLAGMMWHPERENYGFFNQCCERENFFQWALKMTEKK